MNVLKTIAKSNRYTFMWSVFLGVFVLFNFQNCAPPLESTGESSQSSLGGVPKNAKSIYDISVDTLAYMSCQRSSLTEDTQVDPGLFTFKVGAYKNGSGLKLSDEFKDKNGHYTKEKLYSVLDGDPLNGVAVLQMSLRQSSDLTQFPPGVPERTSFPLARVLSHSSIVGSLHEMAKGNRLNYFKKLPGLPGRHVHGTLTAMHTSRTAQSSLLSRLYNDTKIVMSVVDRNNMKMLSSETNGENKYFGVGLNVSSLHRKITEVRETDLYTGLAGSSWTCDSAMALMIVDINDQINDKTLCPILSDAAQMASLNSTDQAKLNRIRRIIDPTFTHWYINFAKKCMVAKHSGAKCYDSTNSGTDIAYDSPTNCATGTCPQYLSVCTKL